MPNNKLTDLIWYLAGETSKSNHAIIWDTQRACCLPVVASPISNYLHEVGRFLFDGGLNVDVEYVDSQDARQTFVEDLITKNSLQSSLESIWETGAITGELLVVLRLSGDNYSFEWFDKTEFTPGLNEITVETLRDIDGKTYVYKLDITPSAYIEYPLVEKQYAYLYDWAANQEVVPHAYQEIPAIVIKNAVTLGSNRGESEFNFGACRLAASVIMATFDSLENVHFFGSPMLASPDPEDTLKRLKKRIQVLQKESNEDGGTVDVLNYQAISEEHLKLIDKLENNMNRHMGIRVGGEAKASADVSSLALRILNSSTISKAEGKWQNYVEDGLVLVFELALRMSAADGMLLMVNPSVPESYKVAVTRKMPYFVESPMEKSQLLSVAQQMVDLGVDRIEALKATVWPHLSIGQIEEKLRINLEDV